MSPRRCHYRFAILALLDRNEKLKKELCNMSGAQKPAEGIRGKKLNDISVLREEFACIQRTIRKVHEMFFVERQSCTES